MSRVFSLSPDPQKSVAEEGGLDTLLSVSLIVLVGAAVSNLACYTLWPQSATKNLQDDMTKTLDSFVTLLRMLTSTFLLEDEAVEHHHHMPSHDRLQKAIESHQGSFTSLKKNLAEVRSEWFFNGGRGSRRARAGGRGAGRGSAYGDAVDSLNRLAQHLNGLRSGARMQFDLGRARKERNAGADKGKGRECDTGQEQEGEETEAAALMFGDLVDDLGPPMKALSVWTPFLSGIAHVLNAA